MKTTRIASSVTPLLRAEFRTKFLYTKCFTINKTRINNINNLWHIRVTLVGDSQDLYLVRCYYRPKRSFGQGNIFTPVCHSVHRGWGSPACLAGQSWESLVSGGGSPIFQGVCVGIPACLAGQSPGGSGPGGLQFFGGVSPIFQGGLQFLGVSNFSGGLQFFWGISNFFGGVKGGPPSFFLLISAFVGDTPTPGPDTGIRSTFGRYTSYWNAFLFCECRWSGYHEVLSTLKPYLMQRIFLNFYTHRWRGQNTPGASART